MCRQIDAEEPPHGCMCTRSQVHTVPHADMQTGSDKHSETGRKTFTAQTQAQEQAQDVQTKHWLLEALRSRLPLPHTHRHCISVSPKPYSPHRWGPPGPFPNSPPFLMPEAAGSWIPRARRATKRKLWAVMFLLPAPNKVKPRGL